MVGRPGAGTPYFSIDDALEDIDGGDGDGSGGAGSGVLSSI